MAQYYKNRSGDRYEGNWYGALVLSTGYCTGKAGYKSLL